MITIVLTFAALTALFEAILLMKFSSVAWLTSNFTIRTPVRVTTFRWKMDTKQLVPHASAVHLIAIVANLIIHWGTVVGTMTAVTAGLVSFITVPLVIYVMRWREVT